MRWKKRRISHFLSFFFSPSSKRFFPLLYTWGMRQPTMNQMENQYLIRFCIIRPHTNAYTLTNNAEERQTNSITFVNKSFAMPFFSSSSVVLLMWFTIVHRIFIHFWSVTTFDMDTDYGEHCFVSMSFIIAQSHIMNTFKPFSKLSHTDTIQFENSIR